MRPSPSPRTPSAKQKQSGPGPRASLGSLALTTASAPTPLPRAPQKVPEDAHTLDLVFHDGPTPGQGFVDDNGGLDYHIPVAGGVGPAPALKVVHIAVEMAPIAKARPASCT